MKLTSISEEHLQFRDDAKAGGTRSRKNGRKVCRGQARSRVEGFRAVRIFTARGHRHSGIDTLCLGTIRISYYLVLCENNIVFHDRELGYQKK